MTFDLVKNITFRILGLVLVLGGVYTFYNFGQQLTPLFSRLIANAYDPFGLFAILASFFLGVPAMVWVGVRLLFLRSFSFRWLYYAIIPVSVWLQELAHVGLIFKMDKILSESVLFIAIYISIYYLARFVHRYWFSPLSHEEMGHIKLERPDGPSKRWLTWIIGVLIFVILIILHPTDIATTLRMLLSPITELPSLL